MLSVLISFVCTFCLTNCFLLESGNTVQPGNNQKYLSFETFVAEKDELSHEIDQSQHKTEQKLQVLTSQLNRKLAALENKINKHEPRNDSCQSCKNVEKQFHTLQENYTQLQGELISLFDQYKVQGAAMIRLENKTMELEKEMANLYQMKSVQQFHDLQSMQQQVQSLQQKTALLTSNQNARNQDFLALYNQTLSAEQTIRSLQGQATLSDRNIKDLRINTTGLFQNLAILQNHTYQELFSKVADNSKQVALSACTDAITPDRDGTVYFQHIYTQIGINDIASFLSIGKFTCETDGLYHISAHLRTNGDSYAYYIMKNDHILSVSSSIYWPSEQVKYLHATSPIIAVVAATQNDTLYVKTSPKLNIEASYSCLTIVKVK